MALVLMDGFDAYVANATLLANGPILRKWGSLFSTNPQPITATGRNGGLSFNPAGSELVSIPFAATTTWICGFAFYRENSNNNYVILKFYDSGSVQCSLFLNTTNQLGFLNGTSGASLATGTTALSVATWYYVEIKVTIHNTAGSVEIRLNGSGSAEAIATSINTRTTSNNTSNKISLSTNGSGNQIRIDDFYLCDTTGAANNNFLGNMTIETVFPNAAGNYSQWTPTSGANYTTVNEPAVNDDTSYVSTTTVNNIDTYKFPNLSVVHSSVKAIDVNNVIRKNKAGGGRAVAPVVRISSTDYVGTNTNVVDSYLNLTQLYETNPATSSAWTATDINNAEFGAKLIS